MSYLRSIASGLTRPMSVPLNAIRNAIRRYYTRLNGASWFQFAPKTFSGDFYLKLKGTFSVNGFYLFSNNTSTNKVNRLLIASTGEIYGFGESIIATISTINFATLTDGSAHTILVTREANICTVYMDNLIVASGVCDYGDVTINSIGDSYAGITNIPNFVGYIYDVDINGQHFYPIDEPYSALLSYRDTIGGNDAQGYNITSDDVTQEIV